MSRFDDEMEEYVPELMDVFGDTFEYLPLGAAGNMRDVDVMFVRDQKFYGQGGRMNFDELIIQVSSRDDSEGVIEPNHRPPHRDQFRDPDSGKAWYVVELMQDGIKTGSGLHMLRLKDKPV